MKTKLICIITIIAMLCTVMTVGCFASANVPNGTVVFYDALTDSVIGTLDGAETVYAGVSFASPATDAKLIAATYSDDNTLITVVTKPIDSSESVRSYLTDAIDVSGASMLKVLVWGGSDGLVPALNNCGTIRRDTAVGSDKFAVAFENTDDYIYRVGNIDSVRLASLFEAVEGAEIDSSKVAATVMNIAGDAAGTFTADTSDWTNGTVKFTGTGIVQITLSDNNCTAPAVLMVEVIDAVNATSAVSATSNNVVLLNDVSGTFSVSGGNTFYGNGHKVTLPPAGHSSSWSSGIVGYITVTGGNLDNVRIEGPVYPETYIYRDQAGNETDGCSYFRNGVIINSGSCTISNSYISGARAAVYVKGGDDIVIENTTVSGGAYANIEVSVADSITLRDVTTVQKETENSYNIIDSGNNLKKLIGMGVVVDNSATKVNIEGSISQYNWINESQWDAMLGSYSSQFPDLFGDGTYSDYWHYLEADTSSLTKYVNLGFIFACAWDSSVINDNRTDKTPVYAVKDISIAGTTGGVYSTIGAGALTDSLFVNPEYSSVAQYAVAPEYEFDFTDKNYEAKSDGSNVYCYKDSIDGKVHISFDEGGSKTWDTSILNNLNKYSYPLDYSVTVNGTDYTGKTVVFDESGEYDIVYTYTDPYNYIYDESGNLSAYSKQYSQTVSVTVTEVKAAAKNASFTFGADAKGAERIIVGSDTYLSVTGVDDPSLTSTASATFATGAQTATSQSVKYDSGKKWGSTVIGGQTYYFPVVNMFTSDGKWEHSSIGNWYGCFPVFDGAVTITDYSDGGTGAQIVYNSSTTTAPDTLEAIYPQATFRHQGTVSKVPTTPAVVSGKLCYTTETNLSGTNERGEEWILAKYKYTDNAGTTYYYYIAYYCQASSGGGICVTPDTLVTMGDGSRKEIRDVSVGDMVVAWSFDKGAYETVPATLAQLDGSGYMDVLHLYFEDGTELKVVGEHGIFDADLNTFIFIDKNDADSYLGHSFVKKDGESYTTVKLTNYEITSEDTEAYTILSSGNYNVMLEDMFTVTPAHVGDNFFNPFEIKAGLKYDEASKQADIEKYGLYTYDDFANVLTYEQFVALNMPQLKVSVGKGYVSYDGLIYLIENFVNR